MNNRSFVRSYLLRFDFSKKVIFVIVISILIALFLLLAVLLTYSGLTSVLNKQLTGLNFHLQIMSIYQTAVRYQSNLYVSSAENSAKLEARLLTTQPLLSFIIEDLKNYIEQNHLDFAPDFLKRIQELNKQIQTDILAIYQNRLNEPFEADELNDLLRKLKKHLRLLLNLIDIIFELSLHINEQTGVQLNFLVHGLPAYQDALSELLSIDFKHVTPELKIKIQMQQQLADDYLTALLSLSGSLLDHEKKEEPVNFFFTTATNFSNTFSSWLDQKKKLDVLSNNLEKLGIKAIHNSRTLYNQVFKHLKKNLENELLGFYIRMFISTLLFFLGIFIILTPYLALAFRRPLGDLKNAIEKLTGGDLSVRIPNIYPDEVGAVSQSFNETAQVFETIMQSTDHLAKNLAKYSFEIFSCAHNLAHNLNVQEKTVQAINYQSKNILQTVQEFSQNLPQVNSTIRRTSEQIYLSQNSLKELEGIMQQMADSSTRTVSALSSIQSEINKITLIIQTLVNIADQINLLSINTAIRASKAGLKTLGYAVLADKIRDLADRTAYATLDMEKIVHQILAFVPDIIQGIDQFSQEIQGALDDSIIIREQFQRWLAITQTQILSFQEIHKGMQEQVHETTEIDKAIYDLTSSTQKTKNSVQNLSAEIEYLHHSTKSLLGMTKRFSQHKNSR